MKRVKDGEKMMGPMFPRLHVNDTEKGGPRAPPRNKMALYEQLSIPSQRFARSNNIAADVAPPSSQMPPTHPPEMQYSQYSDLTTPLPQAEPRKKPNEDECIVPIFIRSIPIKNTDTLLNNTDWDKNSPTNSSFSHHSSERQTTGGKSNIVDLEEETRYSPSDRNVVLDHKGEMGNLERGDSVSETSVLDVVSEVDVTPDDVVGAIGQKHFWKARRAIVNQQRVFAVQIFELHRLIKVQRLISASPHLLLEDSTFFSKPIKPLPAKKLQSDTLPEKNLQLDNTVKATITVLKRKADFEKPTRKNESYAENTLEQKASQNGPSNGNSPSPPSTVSSDHNNVNPCFNQPQGQHWLIPVMSPSEGLVYKLYPGPGPGPNPMIGNFVAPGYGVPALHPQYHFPSYPPFGPHSYFPPYAMPVMNTSAFSGPSVEQTNPGPPLFPAGSADYNMTTPVPSQNNGHVSKDIGVQGSTESSPNKKRPSGKKSRAVEGTNMLPRFLMAPANSGNDSGSQVSEPDGPTRVIKVVARNGVSASEYAARIFRSIQEERNVYESV
ncbi:protein early flowering 3 [Phtheirospermum japonicum]|uniref:Protein early flowering 3 n=1 Tax=Phtheirospermum japonicum TaxID=374723 RepID=A0A830BVW0_9LAMI|nr:protein early flowering 3 [Phtheirospermum japonicum]